jgi:hypothetical protein
MSTGKGKRKRKGKVGGVHFTDSVLEKDSTKQAKGKARESLDSAGGAGGAGAGAADGGDAGATQAYVSAGDTPVKAADAGAVGMATLAYNDDAPRSSLSISNEVTAPHPQRVFSRPKTQMH